MKKKILITGVSGLLGSNLAFAWRDRHEISGIYHDHPVVIDGIKVFRADITNKDEIVDIIRKTNPDVVIHCAALANVDFCEENQDLAERVNAGGTKTIVDALKNTNIKLIYISTDSVYGGKKGNFSEDDDPAPVNYYAQTKLRAEKTALQHENTMVVRTAFFGWNIIHKKNFAEEIIEKLSAMQVIEGWADVQTSMLYTFDLAAILDKAIAKDLKGVYNCACRDNCTKYEFADKLANQMHLEKKYIARVTSKETKVKAKRSNVLSLNVEKLSRALEAPMPLIAECAEHFARDYEQGLPQKLKGQKGDCHPIYPRLDYIPYGRQHITQADIDAVITVLKSRNLTQGPKVTDFEEELRQKIDVTPHLWCIAVNSGTSALHIACLAAGIGPGDEVITSPNTFVASANCVVYCGGTPVFADIDAKTYNISPQEIEKKITQHTKAVIPVHFAGQSCDMEAIKKVVDKKAKEFGHKIFIIEDASHALGSVYRGAKVGSCQYSDMTTMSFHPVKHITTGEGGAVMTRDRELCLKLRKLRSHGITNNPQELKNKNEDWPWYYEQQSLGYNYRITDIQCALGISQLKRLTAFIERRREIVRRYNTAFKEISFLTIPFESSDSQSNFHLYVLLFDFKKIGLSRAQVMRRLRDEGIWTQVHYIPVVSQLFYQKEFQTDLNDFPTTKKYYENCLSIPLYPAMTDEDVNKVVRAVLDIVARSAVLRSRLALGTVQFGQNYGIANQRGKVSAAEVAMILREAKNQGIGVLDTAMGYGESERIIGTFLKSNASNFAVVSKLPALNGQYRPPNEWLQESLQNLSLKSVYGYLVHHFKDYLTYPQMWEQMQTLRQQGTVRKIGFSLYRPEELEKLLERNVDFDLVQIPYSVFDRRFEKYFSLLKRTGVEIHVRSIYLQGLAFLGEKKLPSELKKAAAPLKHLYQLAHEHRVGVSAICLNFALMNPSVDKVVIGVDGLKHLQENIVSLDFFDQVRALASELKNVSIEEEDILLPFRWPGKTVQLAADGGPADE